MNSTIVINVAIPMSRFTVSPRSLDLVYLVRIEQVRRAGDSQGFETLHEPWSDPGGPKFSLYRAIRIQPRLFEGEDFLQGNDIALHTANLLQADQLATAVGETCGVDNDINGRADVMPQKPRWDIEAGHRHHRLNPDQGISGTIGVDGRQRAIVPGIHRLQHI